MYFREWGEMINRHRSTQYHFPFSFRKEIPYDSHISMIYLWFFIISQFQRGDEWVGYKPIEPGRVTKRIRQETNPMGVRLKGKKEYIFIFTFYFCLYSKCRKKEDHHPSNLHSIHTKAHILSPHFCFILCTAYVLARERMEK